MKQDEIKSVFLILDYDCAPEDISKTLGMEPTETITKGDIKKVDPSGVHPPILHKRNVWALKFELPVNADVYDHINYALTELRSKTKEIVELTSKYSGELSVYGFAKDHDRVAIHLDKEVIKQLSELNISLDIDVYPS